LDENQSCFCYDIWLVDVTSYGGYQPSIVCEVTTVTRNEKIKSTGNHNDF